jgi:hypothetical protein
MDINIVGCAAEYRFAVMAMEKGLRISMPLLDSSPYDLIVETPNGLRKVQIKSTKTKDSPRGIKITLKPTGGSYDLNDVDYFGIWIDDYNGFYIIANTGKQTSFRFNKSGKKYSDNFNNFGVLV